MLKDSEQFVNLSESGKAITMNVKKTGFYTVSFTSLMKLKKGEYKAITLTEIVPDEEKKDEVN